MNLYAFGKPIVSFFYRLLFRYKVEGREHIPETGGVLICSNHLSDLDPPLVGLASPRELSYLAKEELFKIPLFGRLIRHLNAVPIRRGSGDRHALRTAMRLLQEGHALVMFPEGRRNRSGHLLKGMAGAGFFALRTDASVIPCAIIGQYKLGRPIRVIFGEPIDTQKMKEKKMRASDVSSMIMDHIRRLMEESR